MLSADFEFELSHNVRQALSSGCTEFLEHLRALSETARARKRRQSRAEGKGGAQPRASVAQTSG